MPDVQPEAGRHKDERSACGHLLLDWYDRHHRDLPWRVSPAAAARGIRPDPYHVWLSEVMLQQTTVEAVKPYFAGFLERWPSVEALAAAGQDDVMKAWAGLGYYSRARNLKKCADAVVADHGGHFPESETGLLSLPGIGAYTAAAVAAIAFSRPAPVVDGNVERVVTRLFAIDTPLPQAKGRIRNEVAAMLPAARPGDFAQAMMDLGATLCSPKRPKCMMCPLREHCLALATDDPERFPVKAPKRDKPMRRGAAFVAVREDGAVHLRKREAKGLLEGMSEVPTSDWNARRDGATGIDAAPFRAKWRAVGSIDHVFTHFALRLDIYRADIADAALPKGGWWSSPDEIHGEALPTLMKKALEAAVPGITKKPNASRH